MKQEKGFDLLYFKSTLNTVIFWLVPTMAPQTLDELTHSYLT